MDYKKTLNLPQTGFPMKADLVNREPQRLEQWHSSGLYQQIQKHREGAERFIFHDGPPFANGDVHIGTALNKVLKDCIIKYNTLRGKQVPYVPGWDCHGLPIEFKVTQEMRKAGRTDADAATIRKACEAYARKYIDLQRTQFKRLGVLGEWENPYLTLNKEYEAAELRLFADIVEKGFVYRGKKPVYWSIPCRTALAEAEVEYHDHISPSIYVKFPVVDQPNMFVLIWTTTPWTLPANLAVAYNSKFNYTQIQVGDETFLLSVGLLDSVAEKFGWSDYQIIQTLDSHQLQQIEYRHPFCNRTGKLYEGEFVDDSTGTGFVHIAPGHGTDDYILGRTHGLPIYSPVDDGGRLARTGDLPEDQQIGDDLIGKAILEKKGSSEANEAVMQVLRDKQALVHHEDYPHSYPHCWRSKTPVVFRAMDQWFIRVDHQGFREQALEEINHVQWIPDWGKNRIEGAVSARPDWCISRQRTWGVPIPAFYNERGEPVLDARIVRRFAELVEQNGSNVWFERSAEALWADLKPDDWTGAEPERKSTDTLDVWIDSGSSSRSVTMRRGELNAGKSASDAPWQADMYLEGSDQHRGWFQSSLLLSLAGNGSAPFKTVLTHGFVVKASQLDSKKKEKVSKSAQGSYEKPQTADVYVKDYGADVVRLWFSSQDFRGDIWVSEDRIKKVSETYRLLRNTLRYQVSNLFDYDPEKDAVPEEELAGLDRWALEAWSKTEQDAIKAYDAYEFHTVYQRLSQFASVELSAIYHDLVKDRLYTHSADANTRRSTQTVLHRILTNLCQALSPILAFTADEAWTFIPGVEQDTSIHMTDWQPIGFTRAPDEIKLWNQLFELREKVLLQLEKARQDKLIGKALEGHVILRAKPDLLEPFESNQVALKELLNVSQLTLDAATEPQDSEEIQIEIAVADGQKCGRCWHRETDVGSNPDHPTICGRCIQAIDA